MSQADEAAAKAKEDEGYVRVKALMPQTPTVDMDEPPDEVAYLHYKPEETKVVSGPVGPVKKYPGTAWASRALAMAHWKQRAGRIIEDLSVPGRWIFRVRRDA